MGVRVIHDNDQGLACLHDSVTGWAFGPVAHCPTGDEWDAHAVIEAFLQYLYTCGYGRPQRLPQKQLENLWRTFLHDHASDDETMGRLLAASEGG